jgi:hypothetical protein
VTATDAGPRAASQTGTTELTEGTMYTDPAVAAAAARLAGGRLSAHFAALPVKAGNVIGGVRRPGGGTALWLR